MENSYEADLSDWDIMVGYDFIVSYSAGALPHRATLICEANERRSFLSPHYAHGASHSTGEEEEKFVLAVKVAGVKSRGSIGEHFQEYGLSWDAYCQMMEALGMETPLPDVVPWKEAPKLQKCATYWQIGDSTWDNTGAQNRFGPREAGDGEVRQGATGRRQGGDSKTTG